MRLLLLADPLEGSYFLGFCALPLGPYGMRLRIVEEDLVEQLLQCGADGVGVVGSGHARTLPADSPCRIYGAARGRGRVLTAHQPGCRVRASAPPPHLFGPEKAETPAVLSYGMGVDSSALLLQWLHEPEIRLLDERFDAERWADCR